MSGAGESNRRFERRESDVGGAHSGFRIAPATGLVCVTRLLDDDQLETSALGRQPLERVAVAAPPSEVDTLRIMSGVEFLAGYSPLHVSYAPAELERRLAPSLPLGQFRYYTDPRGVPLAFCNWAWLDARVLGEALAAGRDLTAEEFQCGDLPFFCEFLAPFGHCRAVARDLRRLPFFRGRRIPALRAKAGGGNFTRRVAFFHF